MPRKALKQKKKVTALSKRCDVINVRALFWSAALPPMKEATETD
jgi:hypothetical protein